MHGTRPVNESGPRNPTPVVVYGGHTPTLRDPFPVGLPCPICGYPPREYAHMASGQVYAYHAWKDGIREFRRICEIQ